MSVNSIHAKKMCYQESHVHVPGVIKDVFDGSHYQSLLNTIVPGGEDNPFFYFSNECDIALGLSMDALLHSRNTIRLVGPSYYSTTISILKFSSKRNTAFMLP